MNPPLVRVYVDQMLFCLLDFGDSPYLLTSDPLKTYGNTREMVEREKKACSQQALELFNDGTFVWSITLSVTIFNLPCSTPQDLKVKFAFCTREC